MDVSGSFVKFLNIYINLSFIKLYEVDSFIIPILLVKKKQEKQQQQ